MAVGGASPGRSIAGDELKSPFPTIGEKVESSSTVTFIVDRLFTSCGCGFIKVSSFTDGRRVRDGDG